MMNYMKIILEYLAALSLYKYTKHGVNQLFSKGELDVVVVEHQTPNREVLGSKKIKKSTRNPPNICRSIGQ